jgi:hypothetical protein
MDRPVLLIEAPILSDDAAASVMDFLQALILAFESHYYPQLRRHAGGSLHLGNIGTPCAEEADLKDPPF